MGKRYFLVDSGGHLFCVSSKDLTVADFETVQIKDEVNFSYGSKSFSGTVLSRADTEKAILDEMKTMKKVKKPKKEPSFDEDKPRKAAVRQRQIVKEAMGPKKKASSSSQNKKSNQKQSEASNKKLRSAAEAAMDMEVSSISKKIAKEKEEKDLESGDDIKDDLDDEADSSSSSSSECSSVDSKRNKSNKIMGKKDDIKTLKSLNQGDHSDSSDENVPLKNKREQLMNKELNCSVPAVKKAQASHVSCSSTDYPSEDVSKSKSKGPKEDDTPKDATPKALSGNEKSREVAISESVSGELDGLVKTQERNKKGKKRGHSTESSDSASSDSKLVKKNKKVKKAKFCDSDAESGEKKAKKRKKTKKNKNKSRKSKKSKKIKRKKKTQKARRNMTIFPGQNFLHSADSENVVKLHDNYEVYVKESDLNDALKSKTCTQFIRQMVDKIFTVEALAGATPQGFPSRGMGKKKCQEKEVLPRLHPHGLKALMARAVAEEQEKKEWRPKVPESQMKAVFSTRVSGFKAKEDSDESTDTSSDSSSSSSDSAGSGSESSD